MPMRRRLVDSLFLIWLLFAIVLTGTVVVPLVLVQLHAALS
jgi:hypothetical protein